MDQGKRHFSQQRRDRGEKTVLAQRTELKQVVLQQPFSLVVWLSSITLTTESQTCYKYFFASTKFTVYIVNLQYDRMPQWENTRWKGSWFKSH